MKLRLSYPQEFLENPRNTMGTLLFVHPIVPWTFLVGRFKHEPSKVPLLLGGGVVYQVASLDIFSL